MTLNVIRATLEYQLGRTILDTRNATSSPYRKNDNGGGGATPQSHNINDYAIRHNINNYHIKPFSIMLLYKLASIRAHYKHHEYHYHMAHRILLENKPSEILNADEIKELLLSDICSVAGITDTVIYTLGCTLMEHKKRWYKGHFYHALGFAKERLDRFKHAMYLQAIIYTHLQSYPKNLFYNAINFLDTSKEGLDFIQENINAIIAWIESSTFKEQYIYTKHPYPPLLDIESIDYSIIPPDCAFALNIPLPNYYNFVVCTSGASGNTAFYMFLSRCVNVIASSARPSSTQKEAYITWYNGLLQASDTYNVVYYVNDREKFDTSRILYNSKLPYLVYQDKDILCLVRDPISRMKSVINHWSINKHAIGFFNLTFDCELLVQDWMWYGYVSGAVPDLAHYLCDEVMLQDRWLQIDSCFQPVNGDVIYIDAKDITDSNTIKTMKYIGNKFGFDIPDDEEFFMAKSGGVIGYMLSGIEKILYVHSSDINKATQDKSSLNMPGGYKIYLKRKLMVKPDGLEIINNVFFEKGAWFDSVDIKIHKQDLIALQQEKPLFDATKRYLHALYTALKKQIEIERAKMVTENDIIDFIQRSGQLEQTKQILSKVAHGIIKKRPDIVESWDYYQKIMHM